MAKKSSQKIRQAKQQKRKNKPKKVARPAPRREKTDWTPRETALMFMSLPELEPVRLDQEAVRQRFEWFDGYLKAELQKPPGQWPSPYDINVSYRQWLDETIDDALVERALQALTEAAAAYPSERRQFEQLQAYALGHRNGDLPADDNPLWAVLLVVAAQKLEPHLLDRARILLEPPRWPVYALDEAVLAQHAGCPVDDVAQAKAALNAGKHHADEPEFASLVKLRARLGNLVAGLTPAERQDALARVHLEWARTQLDSPLAQRLNGASEVSLALFGSFLPNTSDDVLLDPDSPEWELSLAEDCLAEGRYEMGRRMLEALPAADTFFVPLLLARCCRGEGRLDDARACAERSLDMLAGERDHLDDEAYDELRAEIEGMLNC